MRNLLVVVLSVAFIGLGLWQCGSDDGGGGGGGGGNKLASCYGTPGQTCTGTAAYESCIIGKCDAKMKTCYGSDYQNGTFSGACAALLTCTMACKCDATYQGCVTACASAMTAACTTCAMDVGTCIQSAGCVQPVCTGGGTGTGTGTGIGTGTGTGVSGDCSTLSACCGQVSDPTLKNACNQTVTAGVKDACAALLTSYKTAKHCN